MQQWAFDCDVCGYAALTGGFKSSPSSAPQEPPRSAWCHPVFRDKTELTALFGWHLNFDVGRGIQPPLPVVDILTHAQTDTHTHTQWNKLMSACLIFSLLFMLTHIHEQTHIVIVSIVLSWVCEGEKGLPSANPYEMCTKGVKKTKRNIEKITKVLVEKDGPCSRGPGVKWFWTVCHSPHLVLILFNIAPVFLFILSLDFFLLSSVAESCQFKRDVQMRRL